MNEEDLRLDGSAAAGLLQEVIPFELTAARVTCASCGALAPLATATAYVRAPGTIVRCAACRGVLLRVAHGAGRYWLDLRGTVCLEIAEPPPEPLGPAST